MLGTVTTHTCTSGILCSNALGDRHDREPIIYTPPGYDAEGSVDYPVLYALAGFTGSARSFLNYDWYGETLPERVDRLIRDDSMPPVIVVMVDAMTRIGGNQYIDSPAVGMWATHIVAELVPWVESTFRVKRDRTGRGVFGKSSGGYGSLMMALEHADTFAAAASISGDCYFEYAYAADFPKAIDGLHAAGGLQRFLQELHAHNRFPGHLFSALNTVAMSHFYSPSTETEHGFDLPFDPDTGERRDDVWARWLTRDPVRLVPGMSDALKRLQLLWIECGSKDEWNLHHCNRILHARLEDAGVPHEYQEFDDGHRALNYRYDLCLPALVRSIS